MSHFVHTQLNAVAGVEASSSAYTRLHQAMTALGGEKTIKGDSGMLFELPHSQWVVDGWSDTEALRDAVRNRLADIWPDTGVLVVNWSDCAWQLKTAKLTNWLQRSAIG